MGKVFLRLSIVTLCFGMFFELKVLCVKFWDLPLQEILLLINKHCHRKKFMVVVFTTVF